VGKPAPEKLNQSRF